MVHFLNKNQYPGKKQHSIQKKRYMHANESNVRPVTKFSTSIIVNTGYTGIKFSKQYIY
jgi:hypothetical protein